MNLEQIKELIKVLEDSTLTSIEIEDNEQKVKLFKETRVSEVYAPVPPAVQEIAVEAPQAETKPAVEATQTINAPMVGTFYQSPSPDKGPYVQIGDHVTADSVVCILEAMKLFNEIQAEVAGEIVEVLVEDGQMVEYGQPLFKVK
ncbi:acetyl-CoA carboxylase biotin carboxyl carrier protein [Macrococcus bovicus]|uniref:acetyl-CoA carboxylase biotin carboxyl carrier protein n=1 Tax=Macrococcus bovicus TaxID=69968 RepID=UPI0025A65ED5|nr:acetyl-CoA carboxylase biotin carboxyl carrier protein [Macrococcus bovicus]WJP96910.1 acetyl-CoA carboxylase biotin carboxyl carrier protein [Macrococcus bovicus]